MKDKRSPLLLLLAGATLLLVAALIFRDFLFGASVLLYKDIGSDSLIDYYPTFVHLSDYIRQEGIPSWSFSVGMGQDIFYLIGYLVLEPVTWLPKGLIAHALAWQHLAKILVAGLLFFRFLQLRDLPLPASLVGALLISFSAYMCMGACWYPLADEVVCFTGLLYGTEQALKRGRWWTLTIVVAVVGLLGSFYLYLGALFLLFYVPARLFGKYGWQPRLMVRICFVLAGAAVLGICLGAIVTVPHLCAVLNSPRGSAATSAVAKLSSFPLFGFESHLHYVTAALRPFANDLLGTADNFRGWGNYLEAPLTYCGLFGLVILPQAFFGTTQRQRIICALFLAGLAMSTVFPWFRYLFWLFQGDYFRAYSLFGILGIVTLSVMAFSRYVEGRALNLRILFATTIVLLGILYLPLDGFQKRIDASLKLQATIFLVSYTALLMAGQLMKRQRAAAWAIAVLVAVELIQFDHITVSNRKILSKQELQARVGYNDATVDAVRDIKAGDSSFFRISKPRPSAPTIWTSLNDAMVFGYYGTSSYSSFNNVNYTNFLTAVGAMPPNSELSTRWSVGLLDSPILSTFAAEKYVLGDDPAFYQTALQYDFVRSYGKDYLFRNELFLPLGLTFNRYMTEGAFLQLPADKKPAALFRAVILSNIREAQGLSELTVPKLDEEMRASSFSDVIALRRNTALQLTSFHQTRIEGTVQTEQRSILIIQTPFDQGWRAFQDGQPARVLKADVGLLAVALDSGEHKIELRYRTPFLALAITVSLASCFILAACVWRRPLFFVGPIR
jgi:uncharacterized membrane protein YfhO